MRFDLCASTGRSRLAVRAAPSASSFTVTAPPKISFHSTAAVLCYVCCCCVSRGELFSATLLATMSSMSRRLAASCGSTYVHHRRATRVSTAQRRSDEATGPSADTYLIRPLRQLPDVQAYALHQ